MASQPLEAHVVLGNDIDGPRATADYALVLFQAKYTSQPARSIHNIVIGEGARCRRRAPDQQIATRSRHERIVEERGEDLGNVRHPDTRTVCLRVCPPDDRTDLLLRHADPNERKPLASYLATIGPPPFDSVRIVEGERDPPIGKQQDLVLATGTVRSNHDCRWIPYDVHTEPPASAQAANGVADEWARRQGAFDEMYAQGVRGFTTSMNRDMCVAVALYTTARPAVSAPDRSGPRTRLAGRVAGSVSTILAPSNTNHRRVTKSVKSVESPASANSRPGASYSPGPWPRRPTAVTEDRAKSATERRWSPGSVTSTRPSLSSRMFATEVNPSCPRNTPLEGPNETVSTFWALNACGARPNVRPKAKASSKPCAECLCMFIVLGADTNAGI